MPYTEFSRLLKGVGSNTPLGIIVGIRSENDRDTLKRFTKEQHRIRNEWRSGQMTKAMREMTQAEKEAAEKEVQKIFASMFGGG